MPLDQGNGHRGEDLYRELAALPLPGPAVVIDVRQCADEAESRLIWYLAVELEELTKEMRQNGVHRWRYLQAHIEFLRLDIESPYEKLQSSSDLILTTRTGKITILGKEDFAQFVGERCLDLIRDNRINANNDNDEEAQEMYTETVNYEQSTVRIFFLTDMEEPASLARAAIYAQWLKEWSHQAHGPRRMHRDAQLKTVAICLHADPYRHSFFTQAEYPALYTSLDIVILTQSYRDDEGSIKGPAQTYQIELILYTLLLHWPESLETTAWSTLDDPDSLQILPWPTYTVGIASREYSARWGNRWLNYGLAAKILETIRDRPTVELEERELQSEVHEWLTDWWKELQATLPGTFPAVVPELRALTELQRLIHTSAFQGSSLRSSTENLRAFRQHLQTFSQQVSQLYNSRLERTLESHLEILAHLQKAFAQATGDGRRSELDEPYKRLVALQTRAERFLADFFHNEQHKVQHDARGAVPRALFQLSVLTENLKMIQEIQQTPPNLKDYRSRFEKQVEQTYQALVDKLNQKKIWWWLLIGIGNRALQQEYENIQRELARTIQADLVCIRSFIAANVALALLQWADLYDPLNDTCPYQRRLKSVDEILRIAQKQAASEQMFADQYLKLALGQTGTGRHLKNRKELLQWERIKDAFLQVCQELQMHPDSLNQLAETLLRRVGTEAPGDILEDLLARPDNKPGASSDERLEALRTMLVANLLAVETAGSKIADILPVVKQYVVLKKRFQVEPSVLETDVLDMEGSLKEALVELEMDKSRAMRSTIKRALPVEFVLAAWAEHQQRGNTPLAEALDRRGILIRLKERKTNFFQTLEDLRRQSKLFGHPDEMTGDDHFYVFFTPGTASDDFLKAIGHLPIKPPVRFIDPEKLIYLHIHRVRQIQPGLVLLTQ